MRAGWVVEDSQVMKPQRTPSWIALLIAAVSSVVPSPIRRSSFHQQQGFLGPPPRARLHITFGAVILNVSSDHIVGRVTVVSSCSPFRHTRKPISWGRSDAGFDFNRNISGLMEGSMATLDI